MSAWSDFVEFQWAGSLVRRATGSNGRSRGLCRDGIPAVTRIALPLPLGVLLSTLATHKRSIGEPSSLQ